MRPSKQRSFALTEDEAVLRDADNIVRTLIAHHAATTPIERLEILRCAISYSYDHVVEKNSQAIHETSTTEFAQIPSGQFRMLDSAQRLVERLGFVGRTPIVDKLFSSNADVRAGARSLLFVDVLHQAHGYILGKKWIHGADADIDLTGRALAIMMAVGGFALAPPVLPRPHVAPVIETKQQPGGQHAGAAGAGPAVGPAPKQNVGATTAPSSSGTSPTGPQATHGRYGQAPRPPRGRGWVAAASLILVGGLAVGAWTARDRLFEWLRPLSPTSAAERRLSAARSAATELGRLPRTAGQRWVIGGTYEAAWNRIQTIVREATAVGDDANELSKALVYGIGELTSRFEADAFDNPAEFDPSIGSTATSRKAHWEIGGSVLPEVNVAATALNEAVRSSTRRAAARTVARTARGLGWSGQSWKYGGDVAQTWTQIAAIAAEATAERDTSEDLSHDLVGALHELESRFECDAFADPLDFYSLLASTGESRKTAEALGHNVLPRVGFAARAMLDEVDRALRRSDAQRLAKSLRELPDSPGQSWGADGPYATRWREIVSAVESCASNNDSDFILEQRLSSAIEELTKRFESDAFGNPSRFLDLSKGATSSPERVGGMPVDAPTSIKTAVKELMAAAEKSTRRTEARAIVVELQNLPREAAQQWTSEGPYDRAWKGLCLVAENARDANDGSQRLSDSIVAGMNEFANRFENDAFSNADEIWTGVLSPISSMMEKLGGAPPQVVLPKVNLAARKVLEAAKSSAARQIAKGQLKTTKAPEVLPPGRRLTEVRADAAKARRHFEVGRFRGTKHYLQQFAKLMKDTGGVDPEVRRECAAALNSLRRAVRSGRVDGGALLADCRPTLDGLSGSPTFGPDVVAECLMLLGEAAIGSRYPVQLRNGQLTNGIMLDDIFQRASELGHPDAAYYVAARAWREFVDARQRPSTAAERQTLDTNLRNLLDSGAMNGNVDCIVLRAAYQIAKNGPADVVQSAIATIRTHADEGHLNARFLYAAQLLEMNPNDGIAIEIMRDAADLGHVEARDACSKRNIALNDDRYVDRVLRVIKANQQKDGSVLGVFDGMFDKLDGYDRSSVVKALVRIACDKAQSDPIRYLATVGIMQLGSRAEAQTLVSQSEDARNSEEFRILATRAAAALGYDKPFRARIALATGEYEKKRKLLSGRSLEEYTASYHHEMAYEYQGARLDDAALASFKNCAACIDRLDPSAVSPNGAWRSRLSGVFYNIACLHARAFREDEAFEALKQSVRLGDASTVAWARKDGDLELLRRVPDEFEKALIASPSAGAGGGGAGNLEVQSDTASFDLRRPVLKIAKKVPEKRFIGRPIEYEITVTNTGGGTAEGTVCEDTLPTGLTYVSATDGGVNAAGRIRWNLGDMAPKASKTVKATVTWGDSGALSALCNEATARAFCSLPAAEGIPALALEVVDLEDPIEVGKETTYRITVTNQGSAPGTNIVVKVTLDESMKLVSAGGQTTATTHTTAPQGGSVSYAPLASLAPREKATWHLKIRSLKPDDARLAVSMTAAGFTRPYHETEGTRFY